VFQVGDRVVALPEYRAWAELLAVPSRYVYPIPADLSYLDAAAIAMNYLVAYILLFELGGLAPGKSVLVHSAGGGVVSTTWCFPMCEPSVWVRRSLQPGVRAGAGFLIEFQ
jgi:NADPH:quinone reductase-like Zn-dependent oxidoreductase